MLHKIIKLFQVTNCRAATNASNKTQLLQVTNCKYDSNASVKHHIYSTQSANYFKQACKADFHQLQGRTKPMLQTFRWHQ